MFIALTKWAVTIHGRKTAFVGYIKVGSMKIQNWEIYINFKVYHKTSIN